MTTIHATKDYRLHVEVAHLSTGEQCLTIKSSWPASKNPKERRTLFQVTLTPDHMKELATAVLCGSYDHKYSERR
jgi:hypothetical protein